MEIKVGDKIRVNEKGMATDSSDGEAWICIKSKTVDQVKHMEYLTVTGFTTSGNLEVSENVYAWPVGLFEVIPGKEVFLSQEEKDILKELLQSRVDTYTRLLDKLK